MPNDQNLTEFQRKIRRSIKESTYRPEVVPDLSKYQDPYEGMTEFQAWLTKEIEKELFEPDPRKAEIEVRFLMEERSTPHRTLGVFSVWIPIEPAKTPDEVLDQARSLALVRLVAIAEQLQGDLIRPMKYITVNFAVPEEEA